MCSFTRNYFNSKWPSRSSCCKDSPFLDKLHDSERTGLHVVLRQRVPWFRLPWSKGDHCIHSLQHKQLDGGAEPGGMHRSIDHTASFCFKVLLQKPQDVYFVQQYSSSLPADCSLAELITQTLYSIHRSRCLPTSSDFEFQTSTGSQNMCLIR